MLRIHFTAEDLARVRLASGPDPLWETVLTLFRLRSRNTPLAFEGWRREAIGRSQRSALDMLMPLTPGGYFPDFLTPGEAALGLEAGIDAVLSTGIKRLQTEISLLEVPNQRLPPQIQALAGGDVETLRRLGDALRDHHRTVVAPYWSDVEAHIEVDRLKRTRALMEGGSERLLESFRPNMRWSYPVLEADFPVDQDLYLQGRGLLLVPSYFSWNTPDALYDSSLSPVLVYPVQHDLKLTAKGSGAGTGENLSALLGATRAWILGAVEAGCTTSELARRVGVNASSISQHTAVLRDAELIRTTRIGKAVMHTVTPLGRSLLEIKN
ncbi:MAG TPA: winged helix-turn-helix domain-containing protein [Kineosporiaceae bacterium]|nr:winged helix-turn-helix domain-containing protein [Kineosporiaceae bacterium]